MTVKPTHADAAAVAKAVEILRKGGLVAFPTETVYGLGADAANPQAVQKIFIAKGRPADHPLIVHIGSPGLLDDWAQNIPDAALKLAARFWPGPLTLIMQKRPRVPLAVTGGQQTVALRIPDNPVALGLLREFGGGIAAPSANRFNRISPTRAEHVVAELGDSVDMILDGGPCSVGLESTIVDLTGSQPAILRPGHITRLQIEQLLQTPVVVKRRAQTKAPGMLEMHYAPIAPALLYPGDRIDSKIKQLAAQNKKVGVLIHTHSMNEAQNIHVIRMPLAELDYSRELYAALRRLDDLLPDIIVIEQPPDSEEWRAVNDRLGKAASSV